MKKSVLFVHGWRSKQASKQASQRASHKQQQQQEAEPSLLYWIWFFYHSWSASRNPHLLSCTSPPKTSSIAHSCNRKFVAEGNKKIPSILITSQGFVLLSILVFFREREREREILCLWVLLFFLSLRERERERERHRHRQRQCVCARVYLFLCVWVYVLTEERGGWEKAWWVH